MKFVRCTDGTRIAVYDFNNTAEKTIMLIHGWPLNHKQFEYQLPALKHSGYRVVMMDLRGFGASEEAASGYNYKQMASDINQIVKDLNLKKFDLLGFSMGGAVAVKYTALYGAETVNKLLLVDAAVPSYCENENNPYGEQIEETNELINLGYEDRPLLNREFGLKFFEQHHSRMFEMYFQSLSNEASGIGEVESLIALRNEDVYEDLEKIKAHTGIFHGVQDQICPFSMAQLVNEKIKGSELYGYDHAGHGMYYDAMDEFNEDMIMFLKGQTGGN